MKQNFTKADLKDGMVVTYRNGGERVLFNENLYSVSTNKRVEWQSSLDSFTNDLCRESGASGMDIVKVSYNGEVLWEREKIKLTDAERAWLTVAKHDGKHYIARDKDGCVCVYNEIKPHKNDTDWTNGTLSPQGGWRGLFKSADDLFKFISWSDDEPYLIEDLLKL